MKIIFISIQTMFAGSNEGDISKGQNNIASTRKYYKVEHFIFCFNLNQIFQNSI